ncbi:MAG: helix-turn-helix transcriptional regulator [Saprospiraceae bacterium]|nr:helix-turn-helix transcriptional regulator [Saprospiraceae bacterium]
MIDHIMESHYSDDLLKATNLHHRCGMSRSALHYKLKKLAGLPTSKYLTSFRIKKSKYLLTGTQDPIKVIAYQVGFKDPNYFSRVFKNETGIAPGIFRKNKQNEQ